MKQIFKRLFGAMLAIIMVVSIVPFGALQASATGASAQSTITTGSIIPYGSYPQTRVTDSGLIAALNAQPLQSDNTVTYGNSKYKRVYFTQYTPYSTTATPSASNSYQDDNGYYINTIYWFKYEPIQWRVLSNTNGELFVMADKILASRAYNQVYTNVTWETCSMRSWLNNDFYNTAFNSTERSKIKTSTVVNANNQWYGTAGGNNTNDKLFLLSYSEVMNPAYGFSSDYGNYDTARRAQGTDYAKSNGLYVYNSNPYLGNSNWWLRSPGDYPGDAGLVFNDGTVYYYYTDVNYTSIGARPAFKLNLTSDIFTSPTPTAVGGFPYSNQEYNPDIAKMCADIMTDYNEKEDVKTELPKKYGFQPPRITQAVNGDIHGTGYLFSTKKFGDEIVILVAIPGTGPAQWQGNMDITGDTYNAAVRDHYSFNKAKETVKTALTSYIAREKITGKKAFLITGHSRGAAAANLLAKDMTDAGNRVFAYTFATPNVSLDAPGAPGSYPNIFNFCFKDDFVTQSPLSTWKYGKYGVTYESVAQDLFYNLRNADFIKAMVTKGTFLFNKYLVSAFTSYMTLMNRDRFNYYNKSLPDITFPWYFVTTHFLLKDSIAPLLSNSWKIAQGYLLTLLAWENDGAKPIITFFSAGALTWINSTHQPNTYLQAVKSDLFRKYPAKSNTRANMIMGIPGSEVTNPNLDEVQKLRSFIEFEDNETLLGWDAEDISTWSGVTWTNDTPNRIQTINIPFLGLCGELDLSDFASLETLDISGNFIEQVNLSGCDTLREFNAAYNRLAALDVSDCPALTNLNCAWNQLETLDTSACEQLQTLSCEYNALADLTVTGNTNLLELYCAGNDLADLDLSTNTMLNALDCSNNRLDIREESALMAEIQLIMARDGAWVQYSPQKVEDSAVFHQDELDELAALINTGDNADELGWDIDNPASWAGVEWVKVGEEYRLCRLNISGLALTGSLDVSGFTSLVELSCEGTQLTAVDASGCTSLQYLFASSAGLRSLNITGCESLLHAQCDRNYLDVSEGTPLRGVLDSLLASENIAEFEPQYIDAPADDFNAEEYAALTAFAQTQDNEEILGWDLNKPGEWSGVKWEEVNGKYCAAQVDVSRTGLTGDLVLTSFEHLSSVRGAGSAISSLTLPDTLSAIEDRAFSGCENLASVTVPQATQTVGTNAFAYCDNLETVTLGEAMADVGIGAFLGCEKLQSVIVPPGNTNFKVDDGVLFSKDGTRLVYYPPAKPMAEYTVPDNVTDLQEGAFMDSNNLTRVSIGKGLTTVKQAAFSRCENLEEVLLPECITEIEAYAFAYCPKLNNVILPTGITTIKDHAFYGCMGLEKVVADRALTDIGEHAFGYFEDEYLPLPSLTLHCFDGSAAHNYAVENGIGVYTFKFSLPQNSAAKVNLRDGFVYGLTPGLTSLDGYLEPVEGFAFEYIPTANGFGTGTGVNIRANTKSGEIVERYTIVIFGDVNGDGNIDSLDAGSIVDYENYMVTWDPIADAANIKAADLNGDGNIDSMDAGITVDAENYMVIIDQGTGEITDESKITFDSAGGSAIEPITGYAGDPVVAPANPEKEGYTFAGWNPALPATFPDTSLTVTAMWVANTYNAYFLVDGEEYSVIPITYGEHISYPSDPYKDEYTFLGWDADYDTMPAHDVYFNASFVIYREVSSIEVTKLPDKTEFSPEFESLDFSGLEITIYYTDGTSAVWAFDSFDNMSFNGFPVELDTDDVANGLGTRTIIVYYLGSHTTFDVESVIYPTGLVLELDTEHIITEDTTPIYIVDGLYIHFFSFTPVETGYYSFYSMGDIDTFAFLMNEFGEFLAQDDGSGEGVNFRLNCELTAGVKYTLLIYCEVDSFSEYGSYSVCLEKL